ncbi:MAG TPA: hypothetical protein ENK56_07015, partial [Chloroflexi bacterium]|nr:hypothetical protein [Chloroflexota bacterium]
LWVHDDVSKPPMQGEEIYYSVYDGSTWSPPAGITNDNLQDFAPQAAYDGSGHAVAVWERNKTVQTESSEFDAEYAKAFEIAYAVWDGSSWSSPTYLTHNDVLDHAPVLAQGNDTKLLLVWRQNPAGELMGTITNTDTLYWTVWDGTAWSTPQVLLSNVAGVVGLTAARHDGIRMAVAYSRDTDGNLSTSADQELYLLTWTGSGWSGPLRLTQDTQPDNRPTLFYDASGKPRLLWLKGDTLYALLGDLGGSPRAIAVEGSAALLDYDAAQDPQGNLVLLWQGYSPEGVDVFYATYDETFNLFSLVAQLTHDQPLEKFMAPTFFGTRQLLMAYGKDQLVTTTVTISPTLVISDVTTFGQSDLYVLRHTLGPNLSLSEGGITVTSVGTEATVASAQEAMGRRAANPPPGSRVRLSTTLRNVGDLAAATPKVAFYLGDPNAGGTLIGSATAPLTLAGGMTTTVAVTWTIPDTGAPFTLYAVADPDDEVAEQDEGDNETTTAVALPDLTVAEVGVGYGAGQSITLTAVISNVGVVEAANVPVAFRLDDPVTGTEVAQATLGSLVAGGEAQAQAMWDASSVAGGWHKVYAVVDPAGGIVEADEENNLGWAGVGLLPDLVLRPTAVITGINADGTQAVSLWVFNDGQRDAEGVMVGLYNRLPVSGVVPLASTTVSVPAGAYRVVNLNLGSYRWGFYAGVDINQTMEDRDRGNNVLRVGEVPHFVYLPILLRNH